jgi:ATP-dependent DNA helicase RecG
LRYPSTEGFGKTVEKLMPVAAEVINALEAIIAGARARDLEGQVLECKTDVDRSAADTLRLVAEAVACLANAQGGAVIVGIDDRVAGPAAVVGTRLEVDPTRLRVFELTEPGLVVGVERLSRLGRDLLVLDVPISPTVHAVGGRCTERIGSACEPMSPERIATVVGDRRGEDWSGTDSGVGVAAVDPVAMALARAFLDRVPDPTRRSFARQTDSDLLRSLGVLTEHATLTNAAALLFTAALPLTEQIAYVYRRSPAGALVVNEHVAAPLLPALQRIFDLVDARLERTSVNVHGGQQLQVADLPETAVREALVNAVMHRDYRRPGPVVAEHAPTRFAVTSPGPFVTGITPRNVLTASSRTRNQRLATAIRTLGLAETAGTGVDRMFAAMARIGHLPPTYTDGPDHVEVSMVGGAPNAYVTRYASSLPPDESDDADTMLVLFALLNRRTLNAAVAAPLLQRSEAEVQGVLSRLAAAPLDMIEPTRETAHRPRPNYRLRAAVLSVLGPATTYHRRGADDSEHKIVEMTRESGQVNGRMVRLLLDLDAVAASRLLADLVTRGVLTKTSQAQRGPSVTYGPGPAFPSPPRRPRGRPAQ